MWRNHLRKKRSRDVAGTKTFSCYQNAQQVNVANQQLNIECRELKWSCKRPRRRRHPVQLNSGGFMYESRLARAHKSEAFFKKAAWFGIGLTSLVIAYWFLRNGLKFQPMIATVFAVAAFYIGGWCMPARRKFPDTLTVQSSTSGTQFINVSELLLQDSTSYQLELCGLIFATTSNQKTSSQRSING